MHGLWLAVCFLGRASKRRRELRCDKSASKQLGVSLLITRNWEGVPGMRAPPRENSLESVFARVDG